MEKFVRNKNIIREWTAYAFLFVIVLTKVCGMSGQNKIYYCFSAIACVFWLISLLFANNSFKDWVKIGVIFLVPSICFVFNHTPVMIMLAMALVCLKDFDIKKVIKNIGLVWVVVLTIAGLLTICGVIPMNSFQKGREYRWFYYGHNPFHQAVILGIMYFYIIRGKAEWWLAILFSGVNIIVYLLSTSFGGVITGFEIIFGFTLRYYTKKYNLLWKILSYIMICASVSLVLFSFVIGIRYSSMDPLSVKFDNFFTNRVHIMRYIFNAYSVKPFGQKMEGRLDYEIMDNAYLDILIEFGFVLFIIIMLMYVLVIRRFLKQKMYTEIMICCIFFVYAIVEQMFRNCFLNFSLFYFAYIIWDDEKGKKYNTDLWEIIYDKLKVIRHKGR